MERMTVKEASEALGLSKNTIMYRLSKLPPEMFIKEDGKIYIFEEQKSSGFEVVPALVHGLACGDDHFASDIFFQKGTGLCGSGSFRTGGISSGTLFLCDQHENSCQKAGASAASCLLHHICRRTFYRLAFPASAGTESIERQGQM